MKDINLHSAVCMVVMLLLASCNTTFTRHNFLAYDIDEVGVTHIDIREDIFDVKIEPSWSDTLSVEVYAEDITMGGMAGFEKLHFPHINNNKTHSTFLTNPTIPLTPLIYNVSFF